MPIDRVFAEAAVLAAAAGATRAVLLAGGVALVVALAGRALRSGSIQAAAPAAGLVVGWGVVAAGAGAGLAFAPERLPFLPVAALAAALLAGAAGPRRGLAAASMVLLALAAWWLAGAPHRFGGLLAALPALLGVGVLAAGLARGIGQPAWLAVAEAASLWLALVVAGAPAPWITIALVPLAAAAGLLMRARGAAAMLTLHAGILGAAAAALLGAGGLVRGHPGRVDLAVLAPLLVAWLTPWLRPRLRRAPPPAAKTRQRRPRKA
jgi:hypothetical protein